MKNALITALAALLIWSIGSTSAEACCAVTRDGSLVVNADQTVIMIWDHDTRTQHFIRQANFKTDATGVGFIVPFSFQTARPLFPYREPDSSVAKRELNAPSRLLRIYFISDARYLGALDGGGQWTGRAVWVNDISRHRERLLRELGLPSSTGPPKWVLTEFEDRWPYAQASGDLNFFVGSRPKPSRHPQHNITADPRCCAAGFSRRIFRLSSRQTIPQGTADAEG